MYYIGAIDKETGDQIEIFKCATLLREMLEETGGWMQITNKALRYHIRWLNAATAATIRAAFSHITVLRRAVTSGVLTSQTVALPYCEHPALSLPHLGVLRPSVQIPDGTESTCRWASSVHLYNPTTVAIFR